MLNETKELKLASKIRKVAHPQKVARSSESLRFYKKYASFVLKVLRKPRFQRFLKWILRKEKMEEKLVEDVQVRLFPFQKENGNGLAGKYKSDGRILIFPKRFESCYGLMQEHGKEKVLSYIENRAQATLIHEFLHAKYAGDEEEVRKLTKRYFEIFNGNSEHTHELAQMLFKD
ncbi:MAG: hypothetical protein JSV75_02070 [Candidatus Bathyarchaeota archaeon]|nr:MAG: hypothetical protein JSV75_02070 [Candidatus Bathyarchaeota archaeon]